jgi:DNA-binding transcriptional regulator/RsmH inhibitor MraZ
MTKQLQPWKVGCAHAVVSMSVNAAGELLVDREELARLSPQTGRLVSGTFFLTASPDWPAMCLYSESRWETLRKQLQALPGMNPEAREIQRRMLGNAHWFGEEEPIVISVPLTQRSGLNAESERAWLIAFDKDTAELWSETHLLNLVKANPIQTSPLISFIRGEGRDHRGRTLDDVLAMDDFWLEHTHDYIQWLFPLPEPSRANLKAPILTDDDRRAFNTDEYLKSQQRKALDRMLAFFGLVRRDLKIEALPGLNIKDHIWLKSGGHNHLRITRIIRSLHLCQQPELARALQSGFVKIGQFEGQVSEMSVTYWLNANR